jgi:hypothetical protein
LTVAILTEAVAKKVIEVGTSRVAGPREIADIVVSDFRKFHPDC